MDYAFGAPRYVCSFACEGADGYAGVLNTSLDMVFSIFMSPFIMVRCACFTSHPGPGLAGIAPGARATPYAFLLERYVKQPVDRMRSACPWRYGCQPPDATPAHDSAGSMVSVRYCRSPPKQDRVSRRPRLASCCLPSLPRRMAWKGSAGEMMLLEPISRIIDRGYVLSFFARLSSAARPGCMVPAAGVDMTTPGCRPTSRRDRAPPCVKGLPTAPYPFPVTGHRSPVARAAHLRVCQTPILAPTRTGWPPCPMAPNRLLRFGVGTPSASRKTSSLPGNFS